MEIINTEIELRNALDSRLQPYVTEALLTRAHYCYASRNMSPRS